MQPVNDDTENLMHIDMPTRDDIDRLASARNPVSVTVYVPTSSVPVDSEHNLLQARALFDTAMERVREQADKHDADAIGAQFEDLLDDAGFWADLGRSLALFITPNSALELRLPNELEAHVSVSDRFSITPLIRAVTFPQAAFVLAISQNGARLVGVTADGSAKEIALPEAPSDAASAAGVPSIGGRAPHGRIQGDEGRKVRLTQYARAVDRALRPLLNGETLPLIIAAAEPILSIYRNNASYSHVAAASIRGNAEELSDLELADSAREILDEIYAEELNALHETFLERRQNGRASADLSDLARAAAFGAIDTLAVDMNAEVAGSVDDEGKLHLNTEHNALEEITRRALAGGARVLALRAADMPEGAQAAGFLRYAV